jgi:hypothetical protein
MGMARFESIFLERNFGFPDAGVANACMLGVLWYGAWRGNERGFDSRFPFFSGKGQICTNNNGSRVQITNEIAIE